jgi:outer membrane receptor for ferrienterochelin and colicins
MGFAWGIFFACLSQSVSATQATNSSPSVPPPAQTPAIEETVVVTATRSDRRLQDEPLRVEVIDSEEIQEKVLMTPGSVAMLLGETTGLRLQVTAPSLGATSVRIQGLRGRYTQMLADGLPLYGATADSFGLLQVSPLDLGQVEVIKGTASALYGSGALAGLVNLVSRRPRLSEREALVNLTTLMGGDATVWLAEEPRDGWSWTVLGGVHGQTRSDLDDDGWTDVPGFERASIRPRVFYENGRGASIFATGGFIGEDRLGGTLNAGVAPDGRGFPEVLETRRSDAGVLARWLVGPTVVSVRGSLARLREDRTFGGLRELSTRRTRFAEGSVSGTRGRHTWVAGTAFQQDRYEPVQIGQAEYLFRSPAIFVQDELTVSRFASMSASGRVEFHSKYGTLASPRVSVLMRPADAWTTRISVGGGSFAPTPFTEVTDETGLSRVAPLVGLDAERVRTASGDVTWRRGPFEITGSVFGSRIAEAVQLVDQEDTRDVGEPYYPVRLLNAPEPTRTWGTEFGVRYRRAPFVAVATHTYTRSTEYDFETGKRREVPLTPRHAASLTLMAAGATWGRAGFEAYYTGRQSLEDNPYRDVSRRYVLFGGLFERRVGVARFFVNVENLADIRQTKYDPLIRPKRLQDGRWTVESWAPLDGRVVNGGVRVAF